MSFVGADNLLENLLVEGSRLKTDLTRKLFNSQVVPMPTESSVPLVKEYQAAMEKYDPQLPLELRDPAHSPQKLSFGSLEGYLNAKLFGEILSRTKEPITREAFRKRAETFGKFNIGLEEKVAFSATDHQALDSVFFTTIENKKYVSVKRWEKFK